MMNICADKIRVIADVHGCADQLENAVNGSDKLVLLGDLIDRGPDSAGVLRMALDWIEAGRAFLVRSNHDDKLYRLLKGNRVRMNRDLSQTMNQIATAPDSEQLKSRFIKVYAETPHIRRFGDYVFAHGAVSKYHFAPPDHPISPTRLRKKIEHMALYGETDGTKDEDGRPVRTYGWVNQLPSDITAIVGHDIRGEQPFIQKADKGEARAIFLDTGCGKGGKLSYVDLPDETFGQISL